MSLKQKILEKAIEVITEREYDEDEMGHEYISSITKKKVIKVDDVVAVLDKATKQIREFLISLDPRWIKYWSPRDKPRKDQTFLCLDYVHDWLIMRDKLLAVLEGEKKEAKP